MVIINDNVLDAEKQDYGKWKTTFSERKKKKKNREMKHSKKKTIPKFLGNCGRLEKVGRPSEKVSLRRQPGEARVPVQVWCVERSIT
ncbi:hypothetical protein CEXT_15351 [Caerostris extrusa]|uniref:Uncharacterized protein n=1 Tax=Caerostris extrusa TaxID=172846 RepID=A0AAV4VCA1_CAEEX|nr:hypothetical protein CEXT_15351 [Caerostris extrusa]